MKNNKMNFAERVLAPTPKWFKILRTVGIALASVGGIIIASPVALPVGLVSAAGYLILGGSIISVVSQTGVKTEEEAEPEK
ncbi:hypothetical protein [Flavobacterium sp.]|uniref:hypothetical protein n=1 Tax=Flavobacterium sp. TaxID=239 RepID=UPI003753E6BF